jgi:cellulose synthase/poly-beta-1,6-N-acetylglucosamine synthase-like glycosyltransferase
MLRRLLGHLEDIDTNDEFSVSVVIADNDRTLTARPIFEEFACRGRLSLTYCSEHRQNIALARNLALHHASGDCIAFIDDDEFPARDWLLKAMSALQGSEVAGVLGPVRPHFERTPPAWIVAGGFCERPEYPTGRLMEWEECRTGNVVFHRRILDGVGEPFLPEFGTGGEDKDFFMRMSQRGHSFLWCNEAVVYETVPEDRWTRSYMLKRALLRGRNILKHPQGRGRLLARSVVAAPAYLAILPFTAVLGQHVFMDYCIRFCDHAGRLLAALGINPVRER